MARYQARPVEAVQWFPPGDPRHSRHSEVEILYRADRSFHAAYLVRRGVPPTMGPGQQLQAGDWLVTDRKGTRIVKPAEFEADYVADGVRP